ncbi:unnamed protein product [Dicrocoelium dendriticum]|nr:unnamed protein product [Dicrocoelium dendriticum]
MSMPDTNDRPVTETVIQQLHWIQRILKIERSSCVPISVPTYDSESKIWSFPTILNENRASTINCSTIRDLTKCSPKSCEVQMIPGYMGPQILKVQFDASICGQLSGPADYRAVVFLINSILNGMKADCPTIRYTKTKDAFDKGSKTGDAGYLSQ